MSVVLFDIYEETKRKYGLELLAGEKGLSRSMNWVYISESILSDEFLKGGELVITTCIQVPDQPSWLSQFVLSAIRSGACGLIINTGKYIMPDQITPEICSLCDEHAFPLFTMPWETHISELTHDYYDHIFMNQRQNERICQCLLDLIHQRGSVDEHISQLDEYGFPVQGPYMTAYLHLCSAGQTSSLHDRRLENLLSQTVLHVLHPYGHHFFLCRISGGFLFLFHGKAVPRTDEAVAEIVRVMDHSDFHDSYAVGTGTAAHTLKDLSKTVHYSCISAKFSYANHRSLCRFEDLGFYQILLAVPDREILSGFMVSRLGKLKIYDQTHNSNLLETLYHYILCDGSIQAAANALYCHRNTVNNRIRTIKEELGYALDDSHTRFELLIAFHIRNYLSIPISDL